jgi:membrane protein DedA with SNARE-associated domain
LDDVILIKPLTDLGEWFFVGQLKIRFWETLNVWSVHLEGERELEFVKDWVDQYGYIVLFFGLMLELVALPLPGEIMMSYSGFLVSEGRLNWMTSILTAGIGSSLGMTIAYLVGVKLGTPFFHKYGYRIHMGPDQLEKMSRWFAKYGNKILVLGYFIPGVRHITGYFSGITQIPYRTFALYAYVGAFIWSSTFISLGKVLGPKWEEFSGSIKKYLIIGGIIAAVILAGIYLYRNYKQNIIETMKTALDQAVKTFHSLGRLKAVVIGASAVFLGFFILMLSLIDDYLSHEFTQFDTISLFLVHAIFKEAWTPWMKQIAQMASFKVLILVVGLTILWIWVKNRDRRLEAVFLFFVLLGGEILEEGLRRIFHRVGPDDFTLTGNLPYTFPSEQSLMALAVFGFAAFLLVRHSKHVWIRTVAPIAVLIISALVGLSRVFLEVQYPSDVVAGYVFGGVWLSLNIILLEIFRLLREENLEP